MSGLLHFLVPKFGSIKKNDIQKKFRNAWIDGSYITNIYLSIPIGLLIKKSGLVARKMIRDYHQ